MNSLGLHGGLHDRKIPLDNEGGGSHEDGMGLAPGFVCFCVFFNLTGNKLNHNMALGFSVFLGAHYVPGSAPIMAAGSRPGKAEVEGVGPYVLPCMACLTS